MPEAAPPATFRCNPKKRILTIRVALHHVHPSQVDLHTSATRIKLSTRGRRQLSLVRGYPNGMTCDDAQTKARMDGHTLVVELPIVELPQIGGTPRGTAPRDPPAAAAAPAESKTVKRASGAEAPGAKTKKPKAAAKAAADTSATPASSSPATDSAA